MAGILQAHGGWFLCLIPLTTLSVAFLQATGKKESGKRGLPVPMGSITHTNRSPAAGFFLILFHFFTPERHQTWNIPA